MAQLTIPDATFERLRHRAAALHLPVEQLATVVLEQAAGSAQGTLPVPARKLSPEERRALFEQFEAEVQGRKDRYPPGFEADVSRESIYRGCGE